MRKIIGCVIITFIFCGQLIAQNTEHIDQWAPGENIYRHYTGTIGGKKAAVDVRYGFQNASNYGSSTCYFMDEGGLDFFLISKPATTAHSETLRAQVFPENMKITDVKDAYSIFVQTPRFQFNLSHDSLIGEWFIPNTQDIPKMVMTDDDSAMQPSFMHATDSAFATKNGPLKAAVSYAGIRLSPKMKDKDRDFITKAFAQFMGADKTNAKDRDDLSQISFQKFFSDFRAAANKGGDPGGTNFTGDYTLFPVYSENGFFVLQRGGVVYNFENKEYSDKNTYLCLDMTNRAVLKLHDILDVNNDLLSALLEKAFRKKYQLDAGKKLSDLFNGGVLPLTDNFILLGTGLVFSYSPVKIFHDDQDISELQEMRLFLSYDELGSMLKPEFKSRMGLK